VITYVRQLPGFAEREQAELTYNIVVPTCEATRAAMADVPAGPFIYGGLGEPMSEHPFRSDFYEMLHYVVEDVAQLPAFAIDRTEVSNVAFSLFAEMAKVTGIEKLSYYINPTTVGADEPLKPAVMVDWFAARAYCRFLGKELPTNKQWSKAMRGGLALPDGTANLHARRNFPWGGEIRARGHIAANGPVDVGTVPDDVSVYGVLDLAGNVIEWTASEAPLAPGWMITRGGNYIETTRDTHVDFMVIENSRHPRARQFGLGFRCVR
jgi:formylglycine-generating enzyme required for sulfatase activity